MKSGGFFAPVSWPRSETNGEEEWAGKTICHGWRIPRATIFWSLPLELYDRMSYSNGVFGGPWSPLLSSETAAYRRPLAPKPRPLKPEKFFGPLTNTFRLVNELPFQ